MRIGYKASVFLSAFTFLNFVAPTVNAALLVGNSESNNIVIFDEATGTVVGDFTTPGVGGLRAPDDLTFGPDGNLYVSVGGSSGLSLLDPTYPGDSAVLRFSSTGEFLGIAAAGYGLTRPYGNAFGPDGYLYVSSFRTNQILRFDGNTGAFTDVFASDNNHGFGTLNGLNGPNGLLFGPDGSLYVTTEGTINNPDGTLDFAFASQVLRYTPEQVTGLVATTTPEVFIDQPDVLPDTFEFVSLLGLALAPDEQSLFVSDFAGGIRQYDLVTQTLLNVLNTNYTGTDPSSNFIGSLTFGTGSISNTLYTAGFNNSQGAGNIGTILAFAEGQGNATTFTGKAFTSSRLRRPIGITAVPSEAVPEPATVAGFLLGFSGLAAARMRNRKTQAKS